MPLDPLVRTLIDGMAGMPPLHALSVAQAREQIAALGAGAGPPEDVAAVEDRRVTGPRGDIPVRVYTPAGRGPLPVLVFLHGGGWVLGNLETHDGVCRQLANAAGCIITAVDYRLAPEHRFPAGPEDAYAATRWAAANAAALGGDPTRVAVGGDSAGGNLTAVVSLMARDRGGPALAFQLLVYPATDVPGSHPSYRENARGYFLEAESMEWFWKHYAGVADDPYACPLRATDFRGLPPALVITAEFDPLRDEGEAYAARLRDAGVPVRLTRYDGMVHGFFSMAAELPQGRQAIDEAGVALRQAFASA